VSYRGFASRGFRVVGLVDTHPDIVGESISVGDQVLTVSPMGDLEKVVREGGAHIGVIATPADAAQDVCDRLVDAGVRSILNFAPAVLVVPQDVEIRKVDLAVELQILAFHEQRRTEETLPEAMTI
jgi:redox-sensing transcriptional repressor